ncbi:helix-turn-helix domain-containing protein [Streptomyces sp. GLT-R25]
MDATNALGEFLRARRALIRPEDAGIRRSGLRRVPGLRREEVAMLAGISADYYLRLEQGRDRNPSLQVLEALADVLDLDAPATAHLIGLTQARPSQARQSRRSTDRGPAARKPEPVPPGILQLIDGWPSNPAYVENRFTDVLAANPLAVALSPSHSPGVNLIRAIASRRVRTGTAPGLGGTDRGGGRRPAGQRRTRCRRSPPGGTRGRTVRTQ